MKGCKYRIARVKEVMSNSAFEKLIDLFDGELL